MVARFYPRRLPKIAVVNRMDHPNRRPASGAAEDPILAAGIVLWRLSKSGTPEFLLLRNSLHKTWGFPKGHADCSDETLEATAIRETLEETGIRIQPDQLNPHFSDTHIYKTGNRGSLKRVVTWLAEVPAGTEILCSDEHDEHGWFIESSALEHLEHQALRRTLIRAAGRVESALP